MSRFIGLERFSTSDSPGLCRRMVCGLSSAAELPRYRHGILILDLWELPQRRHTDTITVDVERNFYSRCPPNKRPAFLHNLSSDTPLSDSQPELGKTESPSVVNEEKADNPENVEPGSKTEETTEKYDESLFKALHHTFFRRIWGSAILLVVSGQQNLHFGNVLAFL